MKHWIIRTSLIFVVVGIVVLAGSCNPFNPLAAAGFGDLKIYWVATDKSIYISNLDGSNQDIVLSDGALTAFQAITIDKQNGKIYWSDINFIYWADMDGTNRNAVQPQTASCLALDLERKRIFYGSGTSLWQVGLNGSNLLNLYTGTDIHDIEVDHTTSTLYWSEGGDIFKAPIGSDLSTNKTQVSPIAAAGIIDEFSLDISGNTVYYVENSEIKKADFNGQNVVPLFDVGAFSGLVPNSIAVDVHGGKIYWSENSAGLGIFIRRINIDGSGTPETIYSFATEQANDIFLDLWP